MLYPEDYCPEDCYDAEDFDCDEDDCDPGEYVASDEELNVVGDLMCFDDPLD